MLYLLNYLVYTKWACRDLKEFDRAGATKIKARSLLCNQTYHVVDTGEWRKLSVMVSKGDRALLPSVGAATSQLNCTDVWLMPAPWQRSFMTAYLGNGGREGGHRPAG